MIFLTRLFLLWAGLFASLFGVFVDPVSSIIASNEAPAKLLCEKLGWSEEGVKRQALFKRGAYHDVKIMGIVSEDYLKLKQ